MAARSYRPQEWANQGPSRASHMSFASPSDRRRQSGHTSHATGMEASLPSPPPPYVPPSPRSSAHLNLAAEIHPRQDSLGHYGQTNNGTTSSQSLPQLALEVGHQSSQRLQPHRNSVQYLPHTSRGYAGLHHPDPAHTLADPFDSSAQLPPASRRCHSTGELASRFPAAANNAGSTPPQRQGAWQPGIPLPPPPPGPPPPGTRSVSVGHGADRLSLSSSTPLVPPVERRRFGLAEPTPLSPVPPTPADYIGDGDRLNPMASSSPSISSSTQSSTSKVTCLSRHPAQKELRAEAIRDRRSRSRAMRDSLVLEKKPDHPSDHGGPSNRPANLILKVLQKSPIAKRTPLQPDPQPKPPDTSSRDMVTRTKPCPAGEPTPPYSPETAARSIRTSISSVLSPSSLLSPSAGSQSTASSKQTPTTVFTNSTVASPDGPSFINDSLDRLLRFHEAESNAATDQERLRLFTSFIVKESMCRRTQYSSAFDDVAPELFEMTKSMWSNNPGKQAGMAREVSVESFSADSQTRSLSATLDSGTPSEAPMTPATENGSCTSLEADQNILNQSPWNDRYKPCLSPIPSMAVSSVADGSDSRGRTPSRWWEASENGSSGGHQRQAFERSRQETKYMSLHPGILQSPTSPPGSIASQATGGTEYPPEKVGWHDPTTSHSSNESPRLITKSFHENAIRSQPDMSPLDVSRLVTLPPAYPRHYPAVNNCHPQLDPARVKHRDILDLEDVERIRAEYENEEAEIEQRLEAARKERVNSFRLGVQGDINRGAIDRDTALEADRRFRLHELELQARAAREAFERFHEEHFDPVNEQLQTKLEEANICINMMTLALTSTASGEHSATAIVQVGGDEEPELLEQLTLVKWLFEAREKLHEEVFDTCLLERHKYRLHEKFEPSYRTLSQRQRDEGNARFAASIQSMRRDFATSATARFQDLTSLVQQHVSLGVEAQLSAFWDIAPQILAVVQRVPVHHDDALARLPIVIPPAELDENPALARWPAQYLFSTLSHALNSVRQFIDAQVNLLCLLNEVQGMALEAEVSMLEAQGGALGGGDMHAAKEQGRRDLDAELRTKCREIEEGWDAALGAAMEQARRAVRGFLERNGGWEDGLEG